MSRMKEHAWDVGTQGQLFPSKEAAFEAYQENRPDWLAQARWHAETLIRQKGWTTVDEVRRVCPPPASADPRIMGAIFAPKRFIKLGDENSKRTVCHKRPIARFGLRGVA